MKIFVSSTYVDLIEYRKAAERAINLLDQQFKGMEYFGARPEEPKVACLKEIEQAEVFIGIYAHRYGFVPEGDAKSITEQEFDHAQKVGKPILCYRVKSDQPWNPNFIERGDAEKKLADFLKRIEKDFVRGEFTTPDDLLAKISADLARYLAEKHQVTISLIPFPPLPYFVHPYPLQSHFTGRARERALLSEWLTRGERQTEPALVVEAIGGMGKSALAWYWLHNDILSFGIGHLSLLGIFWWSFYDERDFGAFLTRALDYASAGAIVAKTISSDREKLDALVALVRQKRFLLVLDGFERVLRAYARMDAAYRGDEVDKDARDDYRACADPNIGVFLKQVACGGCLSKFLITSRLFPRELDELAGVRHLPLTGMDAADAVAFFQHQKIHGTHAEIEAVCADYGFHPLTLRLLAGTLAHDPRYRADIRNAPRVNPLEQEKERKILDLAYNSLPPREQKLLSQLAAFRSPLKWDALAEIFATGNTGDTEKNKKENSVLSVSSVADSANEDELAAAITDLRERGLYLHDEPTDTYDLHPIIRRYCYDRLSDRAATHARFITYFAKIETPRKIQTLADLQPTIELYHHTVRAGRYDEACDLFYDRLNQATYYQLGAYQLRIELLRARFPDGEDKPPRLKDESAQAWTLNSLANSYSPAGQSRRAVPLSLRVNDIYENVTKNKQHLAIGLGNVADDQLKIGEVKAAEQNLRRLIEICREIKNETDEIEGHLELGRLLAYRGEFAEADKELTIAFEMYGKGKNVQGQGVVSAYRALRALLMGDASAALVAARKAREFAEEDARTSYPVERDFIRAEWMIGAALVAGMTTPTPTLPRSQNQRTGEGCAPEVSPCEAGGVRGGCRRRTPSPRSPRA